MTHGSLPTSGLLFNNSLIRDRGEMINLTDMWIAAKMPAARRPANWARKEGAQFIAFVADSLNVPMGHISSAERGRNGGTYAHWQVAMAYAKALSPEFHMWCNTVVRERMEGRAAVPSMTVTNIAAEVRSVIGGIVKSVVHNEIVAILPAMIRAELANGLMIRRGKTAGQIWREAGLPRIKNVAGWFGNRLERMGCAVNAGERAEMGDVSARLFDPDKAKVWLDNGGRILVSEKIAERQGQGVLKLVLPRKAPVAGLDAMNR